MHKEKRITNWHRRIPGLPKALCSRWEQQNKGLFPTSRIQWDLERPISVEKEVVSDTCLLMAGVLRFRVVFKRGKLLNEI